LTGVQQKLWQLVDNHRLSRTDVTSARLTFAFSPGRDDYFCSVSATIVASNGKKYEAMVHDFY
jgi:hypothetical protein